MLLSITLVLIYKGRTIISNLVKTKRVKSMKGFPEILGKNQTYLKIQIKTIDLSLITIDI